MVGSFGMRTFENDRVSIELPDRFVGPLSGDLDQTVAQT